MFMKNQMGFIKSCCVFKVATIQKSIIMELLKQLLLFSVFKTLIFGVVLGINWCNPADFVTATEILICWLLYAGFKCN